MRNMYFFKTKDEANAKAKELKAKGAHAVIDKSKNLNGAPFEDLTNGETIYIVIHRIS